MQGLNQLELRKNRQPTYPQWNSRVRTFQKNEINLQNGEYTLKGALYNFNSPDKLSMANQGLETTFVCDCKGWNIQIKNEYEYDKTRNFRRSTQQSVIL